MFKNIITALSMLGLLMSTPANSNEVIVKTKIIQKTVIKKVPIYLDRNDKAQIKCLADNAYFEAGNQSTKGKIAVTHVVMNRIGDHRFPTTPCGVIHQKHQFSWFGVKSTIKELNVYNECKQVAEQVYIGKGYGKQIVKDAIERCKEKKCPLLELNTETTNIANNLYKSLGFIQEGMLDGYNHYTLKLS